MRDLLDARRQAASSVLSVSDDVEIGARVLREARLAHDDVQFHVRHPQPDVANMLERTNSNDLLLALEQTDERPAASPAQ